MFVMSSVLELAEHTVDDLDETPHTSQFVELDGVPTDSFPTPKRQIAEFLKLDGVELISNLLVIFNAVAVVAETDAAAEGPQNVPTWVLVVNVVLLAIYCVEIGMRIYISGARFFKYALAVADFAVIMVDVVLEAIHLLAWNDTPVPSLVLLRVFRLLRLRRAFRLMITFPELRVMIHGFTGAFKAIIWGAALIWTALLLWSLVLVQVVHPYNLEVAATGVYEDMGCGRCERAYASVGAALITLTQNILAGDSWGQVAIPVIEHKPWTAPIFIGAILSINLALLNLILAVIVDRAQSAREDDVNHKAYLKRKEKRVAVDKLKKVCRSMDIDDSGTITLKELLQGYDNNREFSAMLSVMDVRKEDIHIVFEIVDEQNEGEVKYDDFVQCLYKMKTSDSHTLLMFMRYYMIEIQKTLGYEIGLVKQLVAAILPSDQPPDPSTYWNAAELATASLGQTASWRSIGIKSSVARTPSVRVSTESEEIARAENMVQSLAAMVPTVRMAMGPEEEMRLDGRKIAGHPRFHREDVEDVAATVNDQAAYVKQGTSSSCVAASTRMSASSNVALGPRHASSGSADWNDTALCASGQAAAAHPLEWASEHSRSNEAVEGQVLGAKPSCSLPAAAPLPKQDALQRVSRDGPAEID